jgi:hypothetical protein
MIDITQLHANDGACFMRASSLGGDTMVEGPHMIACFEDGEYTDTAPADMIAEVIGMTERKVLRYAATSKPIPRTGIRLVDMDSLLLRVAVERPEGPQDFPPDICPGCFMECHRPWPCPEALRRFAIGCGRDG